MSASLALLALALGGLLLMLAAWRAEARRGTAVRRALRARVERVRVTRAPAIEELRPEGGLRNQLFRARLSPRAAAAWLAGAAPLFLLGHAAMGPEAGALAALLAPVSLVLAVRIRMGHFRGRLDAAMPAFLDRLRQQMLVGSSIALALQRAVAASPPIVRWVFEPVERRVSAGGELIETLDWAARRHGGESLAGLVAAVSAAQRFGGRLSEALANLSLMERRREQVRQEMRAATAEVRAGSAILAVLPIGVAAALFTINPAFGEYFADEARGRSLLYGVGALYLIGLVLLRRIAQPRF